MEPTDNIEKAVLADIDGLRKQFPNTQDLYREVCVLMFFRYGMTPTANKLYQLVRKGSMSAPSEALSRFWDNLRDKSRVTIEHPDLPEALKVAAGGLVATLWQSAQDVANEQFSTFKDDAQSKISAAEDATVAAKADRDHALAELSATQDRLGLANKQIDQLSHEVTSLGSTNVSIEGQLQNARADLLDSQARLDACRTDFAAELEKIRLAAKQSEERIAGTEARALVEIDRERVNAAQSRKALEKALAERAAAEGRNRDELLTIQKQLANQNHKNGIQEGELRAMTVNLEKSLIELDRLRVQLNEAGAKNSMLRAERNALEVIRPRPRKASRKLDSTTAEAPTQNTAKRSVRAK
jgi:predicted regulator of Ras-like GTPase activity (Roadblock/LC7/MglB family)